MEFNSGVKRSWGIAILQSDTWALNLQQAEFRIINAKGQEQTFGEPPAKYRKLEDLAKLVGVPDFDAKEHYLVIPNNLSREKLVSGDIWEGLPETIAVLSDDCKEEVPASLAPAYRLGRNVDRAKLTLTECPQVSQAEFSVACNSQVYQNVAKLLEVNPKLRELAKTKNMGVVGHVAYMLANKWNTEDAVYKEILFAWGEQLKEMDAKSRIKDEVIETIAMAYAGLVAEKAQQYANEFEQDRRKVAAVLLDEHDEPL